MWAHDGGGQCLGLNEYGDSATGRTPLDLPVQVSG
jgi:hypothetical protein